MTYKEGKIKKKTIATTHVRQPSSMKIHRQPWYPRIPSTIQRVSYNSKKKTSLSSKDSHQLRGINVLFPIAEAKRPPNAPAKDVDEKKSE